MAKITVKLNEIAQRLGKSIVDISKDTGLNRNTITSLYHNKVDGIKFDTLKKICETYNVGILDIIDFEQPLRQPSGMVKDSREMTPFIVWAWIATNDNLPGEYFNASLGPHATFFQKDYGTFYNDHVSLVRASKEIYRQYNQPEKFEKLAQRIAERSIDMEQAYQQANIKVIDGYTQSELISYFKKLSETYLRFASISTFLHAFDSGYDHEEIERISKQYKFSPQEAAILTSPTVLNFVQERLSKILDFVRKVKAKKLTTEEARIQVPIMLRSDSFGAQFIQQYSFNSSDLLGVVDFTEQQLIDEIMYYVLHDDVYKLATNRIKKQVEAAEKNISKVLRRHKLAENPLWFFKGTAELREFRKRANLMGVYVLDLVLRSVEKRTKISIEYLRYMSFDEFENVLKGLLPITTLKARRDSGMVLVFEKDRYRLLAGKEGEDFRKELDSQVNPDLSAGIINGLVVSAGYGKGVITREIGEPDRNLVLFLDTAKKLEPEEIEGYAAIVSKEAFDEQTAQMIKGLGIPCIQSIGTAADLLYDGDLIEVRANHGTVRLLYRKTK